MSETLPSSSDFEKIAPQTPAEETTVVDDPRPASKVEQPNGLDESADNT